MVKRVKRVKRKRKRSKVGKSKSATAAAEVAGAHKKISATDDDGPDGFTNRSVKKLKKRRSVDGVNSDDDDMDVELATGNAVTRKGDGGMEGDGFGQSAEDKGREAYAQFLRGHVEADAERMESMRQQGAVDNFDPEAGPTAIEASGQMSAAKHIVRLYDHWTLNNLDRTESLERASQFLSGFHRPDNIKKVIAELEGKPIRDLHPYPLEVMMHLLDTKPDKLPGFRYGAVFTEEVAGHVGYPIDVPMPKNHDGSPRRIKGLAYLGKESDLDGDGKLIGEKSPGPGYGIYPSPKKDDAYCVEVDSPGRWCFAALSVATQDLGKITKELSGGTIGRFLVDVKPMGPKS